MYDLEDKFYILAVSMTFKIWKPVLRVWFEMSEPKINLIQFL